MNHVRLAVLAAALAATACSGEQDEAERTPLGTLPPVIGQVMGPQPGPDRPLPKINNPLGMRRNVVVEGRRLFVWYNCYGCHGGRGGGGMGPSLRDAEWLYGSSDEAIFNSIAEGRPHGMPAWGTKLPAEQIWKMTAYIKSMGTDLEPAKPRKNLVYPEPPPRRNVEGVRARLEEDG